MATVQKLLDDIKLRYRHSYTTAQVLVWMNEEQRELFDAFKVEAPPVSFETTDETPYYPIPTGIEITKIQRITLQVNDAVPPSFTDMPYVRSDSQAPWGYWYTIVSNLLYLNAPGGLVDGRYVYIFYDQSPVELAEETVNEEPSTPVKYQEILKLGTLERISAARKDIAMKNNFSTEKESKIMDMLWQMQVNEPEFISPIDVNPKAGGWYG